MEKLYTSKEAAEMLHVSATGLTRMVREGRIKAFRVRSALCGQYRFQEKDIQAVLEPAGASE